MPPCPHQQPEQEMIKRRLLPTVVHEPGIFSVFNLASRIIQGLPPLNHAFYCMKLTIG